MSRIYSALGAVTLGALAIYTAGNAGSVNSELKRANAAISRLESKATEAHHEHAKTLKKVYTGYVALTTISGFAGLLFLRRATDNKENQREYRFASSSEEYPEHS